jgi:5-methylcytosine-specific restriction protein A
MKAWGPVRPCVDCGGPARGTRCRPCFEKSKPPPQGRRRDLDDWKARAARRAAVQAWRREVGDICPGFNRGRHYATDLTADHLLEVRLGGDPRPDEYGILCRGCNSVKSNVQRARARRMAQPRPAAALRDREW